MSDRIISKLFLAPLLLCIALFIIYPIYKVISLSLYSQIVYLPDKRTFVGFENYIKIFSDSGFWNSISNSLIWTVGSIILQLILGITIAVLLNKKFPGVNIVRGVILFSYLVPEIVAVVVWKFMLSESTGIINYFIREFLHLTPPLWFSSRVAMLGVIIVNVWKYFPFMVIVFLAQLQGIDKTQYEAARIDGANSLKEFWYITFPFLKPVIVIAIMLRSVFTLQNFNLIALFTGGGPLDYTTTLPIEIYDTTFKEFYLGKGAAMSAIMFIIILIMSFGYLRAYDKAQKGLY